jgi:biopolymer transport protein ExbB
MEKYKALVDYGVIGFLLLMSIVALSIATERFIVYRRIRMDRYPDKKSLELRLSEKLHIIATIGSNAPYIGLLGTVMGIMMTFYTMGTEGFMNTGKIMVGLALALKATAAGLVVAIPSIIAYNLLLRQVKVLLMQWEIDHGRKGV